jgi:peptide/nickel transport system substrate-binding protein
VKVATRFHPPQTTTARRRASRAHARRALSLAVCVFVFIAFDISCDRRAADEPSGPLELRVGIAEPAGAPTTEASVSQVATRLRFSSLITARADGSIEPGLAEKWQPSEDGLTWRFTLRPGLKFEDGSPLNAAAVAPVLDEARITPRLIPGLRDIVSVKADGDRDVVIELRAPSSLLLEALYLQPITRDEDGRVRAGPYREVSNEPGHVVLQAVDGFYRGRASIDRVDLRGYPTQRAAWVALMRGDIDFLYDVPVEATEFIEASTSVRAYSFLRPFVQLLGFNVESEHLRDPRIRRAIALAIDRPAIIKQALGGRGLPAYSAIWPRHWAYDQSITGEKPDLTRARALLAEALGESAITSNEHPGMGGGRLQLSCLLPSGYPAFERSALLLQRQLLDIGVDLRPEVVPAGQLIQRLSEGRFETYLFEHLTGVGFNWAYWFWHSPEDAMPYVRSGYVAADEVLERIRRTHDQERFRTAVHDLQRVFIDDPPAVFLTWSQTSRAVRRRFLIPEDPDQDIFYSVPRWQVPKEGTLE